MLNRELRCSAVILAAGSGSRMNINQTKQTLCIRGKSVLLRTLEVFDKSPSVTHITVVCKADEVVQT